jgi:hypothetical protein
MLLQLSESIVWVQCANPLSHWWTFGLLSDESITNKADIDIQAQIFIQTWAFISHC